MKIKQIEIGTLDIALKKPFKTALRVVESLESILVRITSEEVFYIGYGETAATEAITGENKRSIIDALERIAKDLIGKMIYSPEDIAAAVNTPIEGNHSAKSAIEIALYDMLSQRSRQPLYAYLKGRKTVFKTGITISLNETETMVRDALEARDSGFESLKIKLGDDYQEDIVRVEEISKAVGEKMSLKLDANQGWTPEESVIFLSHLEAKQLNIELIEQPVDRYDIEGLKYIKEHTNTPILADESVFLPEDARRVLEMQAVDMVNIKLDKCGGITKALEIADICHSYGIECMIGCMMEGAVSVGAAAHVASARSDTVTMIDLDAPMLCQSSPVAGGTCFAGADIALSNEPGLGIKDIVGVQWQQCDE